MTKKPTTRAKEKEKDKEIASLKKQLTSAKKENEFLKKWERYLKDQKKSDSAL